MFILAALRLRSKNPEKRQGAKCSNSRLAVENDTLDQIMMQYPGAVEGVAFHKISDSVPIDSSVMITSLHLQRGTAQPCLCVINIAANYNQGLIDVCAARRWRYLAAVELESMIWGRGQDMRMAVDVPSTFQMQTSRQ
jgi:hypothetical protein